MIICFGRCSCEEDVVWLSVRWSLVVEVVVEVVVVVVLTLVLLVLYVLVLHAGRQALTTI